MLGSVHKLQQALIEKPDAGDRIPGYGGLEPPEALVRVFGGKVVSNDAI